MSQPIVDPFKALEEEINKAVGVAYNNFISSGGANAQGDNLVYATYWRGEWNGLNKVKELIKLVKPIDKPEQPQEQAQAEQAQEQPAPDRRPLQVPGSVPSSPFGVRVRSGFVSDKERKALESKEKKTASK